MARKERFERISQALAQAFPKAEYELNFRSPYQLLVAVTLAARCTDKLVNELTPELFRSYPSAAELADANEQELLRKIAPVTHADTKAHQLIQAAKVITKVFNGEVPSDETNLLRLPGIGRKSTNAILAHAFGQPAVVVDTHVARTSQRLKIATAATPEGIERELRTIIPKERWTVESNRLTLLGRRICTFDHPLCERCPVKLVCKSTEAHTQQLRLW